MKTIKDYMNDPRMLNDPGMAEALEPVKEIHAIRLKIQDETSNMTMEERIKFINSRSRESLSKRGLISRILSHTNQEEAKQQEAVPILVV